MANGNATLRQRELGDDPETEGVRRLLQDGLQMKPGSTLLILCQEDRQDLAGFIADVAAAFHIHVDQRPFGVQAFAGKYPPAFSPASLAEAMPMPQGIILLIEWSVKTTKGRLDLLRQLQATGRGWRIASMPGVTKADLKFCGGSIDDLKRQCSLVFAALARSPRAVVRTTSPDGNEDKLVIPTTDFRPNPSTGAIEAGTWGNFPSGETFVVPNSKGTHGWMTLRGSFPRYVLADGEWLRFEIVKGRLRYKSIEASSNGLKERFAKLFFRQDGKVAFRNANTIAELGVGTNTAITHLTGNPIFDEKRAGTIHLGVGSNTQFHGPIVSKAHSDITSIDATLETASVTIVDRRKFVLKPEDAMPSLRAAGRLYRGPDGLFRLSQSCTYDFHDSDDTLCLTYSSYRGPLTVPIRADGASELAKWILKRAKNEPVTFKALQACLPERSDPSAAGEVFRGLAELGLLEAVGVG